MLVDELLARATSAELAEWMAYDSIEPFGEERADARAAQICALLYNINRGKGKPARPTADFMLVKEPKQPQSVNAQMHLCKRIAQAANRRKK